jgi:hypothetical protein
MRPFLAVSLALAILALAFAAARAADPPATQHVATDDESIAIDVPADWKITREDLKDSPLAFRVAVPASMGWGYLTVYHMNGMRGERGQVYRDRRVQPGLHEDVQGVEVGLEPTPWLTMLVKQNGHEMRKVWIPRVIDRDGFSISFNCSPALWPALKDDTFRAAQSLTSKLGEWPKPPAGFHTSTRDGFRYFVATVVKEKDVETLHAVVLEQEARYAKLHGPLPKPASNPPVIVVTPDNAMAMTITPEAKSETGYATQFVEGRVFAVPMKKDDFRAKSSFAERLVAMFHVQSMGEASWAPEWLFHGERYVVQAEVWGGKPLPSFPPEFGTKLARSLGPFEALTKPNAKDLEAQSFAYVAFFRAGPKPYQDAFAAFLKDTAANGDWEAAQAKHLLSLDQDDLRVAAEKFVSKDLKMLKPR